MPIVFEHAHGFEIFCGFWFDASGRYHIDRHVKEGTPITLDLYGSDLSWKREVTARELAETGRPRIEPRRVE